MNSKEQELFDKLIAEQQQIDALINRGVEFTVPRKGLERIFSRTKERTFAIEEPYLAVLDLLADEFIKMEIDEEQLKSNPESVSNHIVRDHSARLARIVAIAVLNHRCCIHLNKYKWIYNRSLIERYTRYFLARVKPSKLFQIASIIRQISNVGAFINSIRWTSGAMIRTTLPKADLIERKQSEEIALGA